jgi:DNA-binding NtrC family response regulator
MHARDQPSIDLTRPAPAPPARPRVLVADDDLELARTLCEALDDRGYAGFAVGSGREAAELLARERFDALVTDLRMPAVDGLALLTASRQLDPDLPVIVMTAYSAIDTAVESIRRGASHYLTKPFKQDELAIFLQRALDEARLRREATALRIALGDRNPAAAMAANGPARAAGAPAGGAAPTGADPDGESDIQPLRELTRRYAAWAVARTGGHLERAADKLGVDGPTLRRLLGAPAREGGG